MITVSQVTGKISVTYSLTVSPRPPLADTLFHRRENKNTAHTLF